LRLFIGVTVLFTVGMLAAVIALGKESEKKAAGKEKTAAAATTSGAVATVTVTVTTGTPAPKSTGAAPPPKGDAAAGKAVFVGSGGCTACHTFAPAGAKGTIGPDLDHLASDAQKANQGPLKDYVRKSIEDPDAYTVPGFKKGIMSASCCKQLTPKQIDDLVAFLTQGS